MLEFFRKYQRYFFVFISIVIIASFSFFGTFSTFSNDEKKKDRIIAHAVGGSPLMLSEIQALSRFISTDREDALGFGLVPNLCNDGVVRYDLLRTGLADLLAAAYFETIKKDIEARLDRARRFRPYAHSAVPQLSAEAVWDRFLPATKRELASLKQESEAGFSTFSHLSRLYQQQSYLNAETLKKILCFQHQHLGLQIDPRLQHSDLSLFGFHTLADWFGHDFLTIASEFILNASAVAEKKGYDVTLEEAKGDLLVQFQTSLQKLRSDSGQPEIPFSQHLKSLGFDEKNAAEVWRKVLLFRRYFQSVSQTAFVDRLPFKDFALYARETATLSVYQWPSALRLNKIEDLIQFQFYLSAVAPPCENPLDLPVHFYSPEAVEENYPELVQSSYLSKVKEIALPQIALRAQVKEVWDWQLEEKNWDVLKAAFPFLSQGCLREEKFQSLEKLSPSQRLQVDSYARLRLMDQHPEWIEEAMVSAASQERTISISKASCSLPRIEKPWRLRGLLQRAAEGDEQAKQELFAYTDDEKTLYRFEEVENHRSPHILTFNDARVQGLLARLADRSLSAIYAKIRAKHPAKFQSEEGSWKPFSEVKMEVARVVYPDVFRAVEALEKKSWTDDLYAQCRLLPATQMAYEDLRNNPDASSWLAKEKTEVLEDQFKLERNELPIQRTSQEEWMKEKAFVMNSNEWSPIRVPPNGELSFFYLIDKKPCANPILDQISFGKELIAADAQLYLAEKLLESIFQNRSIILPQEGDR